MPRPDPTRPAIRLPWLRRLDHLPPWLALCLGLTAGAALGQLLLMQEVTVTSAAAFVAVLGLAALLAASGEPVLVVEPAEIDETRGRW